ncbi:MAG: hypothetical protein ACQ9MH_27430 [Nitrospinales bacterium]
MKTRIKKIIIMAVALLFVSVGVSFAHDVKGSPKKAPGNAYGYYKKGYDYHPGWNKRHPKPKYNFRDRYRYREVPKLRYHYDRPTPRKGNIIGFKVKEPDYKIVIVVKDRR